MSGLKRKIFFLAILRSLVGFSCFLSFFLFPVSTLFLLFLLYLYLSYTYYRLFFSLLDV